MGLERKGTQFRIRIRPPSVFIKNSFVVLDVGKKGGLQFVRAVPKGMANIKRNLVTQAVRVSVKDFFISRGKLVPKTARGIKQVFALSRIRNRRVMSRLKIYFKF